LLFSAGRIRDIVFIEAAETKNPGLVKEVMRHESLTTTMGYLHPETAQIKVVIDRLNQQKW